MPPAPDRLRVLFLVNALETDAPTQITAATARALHRAGWPVRFVAWSRGGALQAQLQAEGISAVGLTGHTLARAAQLRRLVAEFAPDVIHVALVRPALAIALCRLFGMRKSWRLVAAVHGTHEWTEKPGVASRLMPVVMPVALSQADAVVAVSQASACDLAAYGLASRISVIPNGVDLTRFYPRPRAGRAALLAQAFAAAPPPADTFLIGCAGNLIHLKGHETLLRAAAIVVAQEPRPRFILYGDGPLRQPLLDMRDQLGLRNAVALPGPTADLHLLLPLLDAYVQPSLTESFGLAATEAMACGVATIASQTGGLAELIADGHSGLLVSPGDPSALADALLQLIRRPRARARLASAGRLRIIARYAQPQMTTAMQQLYLDLVNGNP